MLRLGDNTQLAGDDLMAMIEKARNAKHLLEPLGRKVGNRDVVEQTAIAGALNREVLSDSEKATGAAQYVARRLDTLAYPLERGWTGQPDGNGGLVYSRTIRDRKSTRLNSSN